MFFILSIASSCHAIRSNQMKLFVEITFLKGYPTGTRQLDRKCVSDLGNIVNPITHCHYDTIDWTTFGRDISKQQHHRKKNYGDAMVFYQFKSQRHRNTVAFSRLSLKSVWTRHNDGNDCFVPRSRNSFRLPIKTTCLTKLNPENSNEKESDSLLWSPSAAQTLIDNGLCYVGGMYFVFN